MFNIFSLEKFASEQRDYGTVLADFNKSDSEKIFKLSDLISKNDLHEKGVEDKPHVTILYGLHDLKIDDLKDFFKNVSPFEISLNSVSGFLAEDDKDKDFDVLKIDITGAKLHSLNKKVKNLKHTNKYPDYKPHATIAYLKPGKAKKYIKLIEENNYFKPITIKIDNISYSDKNDNVTNFKLRENK